MQKTMLGRTELSVSRTSFGCIPIQRISFDESTAILRRAYAGGINFFDTARGYTDSEQRIGIALGDVRNNVIIASKSMVRAPGDLTRNMETSLSELNTDYIDVFQVHNPGYLPAPGGEDGVYDELLKAKKEGKIRYIGISSHKLPLAVEAVKSGFYDTLQFPLSLLSDDSELALIALCREHNVGLIAMKAMAGGVITNAKAAFAFLRRYGNVVPIWGIMLMEQLEEFLRYEDNPPAPDDELLATIEADRAELKTAFCRGCGYCLPCPAGIKIDTAARIDKLIRRSSPKRFLTPEWYAEMQKIENCTSCGHCKENCPYSLDTPALLKANLADFTQLYNSR